MGLFRKRKSRIIAKVHRAELYIVGLKRGKLCLTAE